VYILCYHDVETKANVSSQYDTSVELFKQQMKFLKEQNYKVVPLSAIADWVKSGTPLPAKAIGICFDDNYMGVYKYAYPILKKYKFPATVFVHTRYVGVMTAKDHPTWKQLQEMEDSADPVRGIMDIGSHTVNHTSLATVSIESARWEITESLKALQTHLKKKPNRYFAYPNVSYNDAVVAEVEKSGFAAGFYGVEGPVDPKESLFKIRRIHISEVSNLEWFKKAIEPAK
jgi:biofilm PGA synthesis lipoprotein PgaB